MSLQVQATQMADHTVLKLFGNMDEEAQLPQIESLHEVRMDLAGLININSIGIRCLGLWMKTLAPRKLVFENCPHFFINQVNMIPDFLPTGSVVESFFVPYFNNETSQEVFVLYRKGMHYWCDDGKNVRLSHPQSFGKVNLAERKLEIDVDPNRFFRFVAKYT